MAIAFPCAWHQWQALLFFPNQLPRLLRMAGCTEMPHNHPFRGREMLVFPGGASSMVQTLKVSREGMIWGLRWFKSEGKNAIHGTWNWSLCAVQ